MPDNPHDFALGPSQLDFLGRVKFDYATVDHPNTYELDIYNESHVTPYYASSTYPSSAIIIFKSTTIIIFHLPLLLLLSTSTSTFPLKLDLTWHRRVLIKGHFNKSNGGFYKSYLIGWAKVLTRPYISHPTLKIELDPGI